MIQAATSGILRHVENTKKGKKPTYGIDPVNDWQAHIEGALGECAVAKALNMYWAGKGTVGAADVGLDLEVRTTPIAKGRLILHPADKDNAAYVLVTGLNGTYQIRGWVYGWDGKQEKYWDDPSEKNRPAFFVPQEDLISFEDLKFAMGVKDNGS